LEGRRCTSQGAGRVTCPLLERTPKPFVTHRWPSPRRVEGLAQEPRDSAGRPYHIRLSRKEVGRVAFLPGDPARVPAIAKKFSHPVELSTNREFAAYGGEVDGEKVVAVSTGIGGPAAAIVAEELARLGVRVLIRVGTCGALVSKVKVGTLVIADAAVRMEGTSYQYVPPGYPAAASPDVVLALAEAARAAKVEAEVGLAASTDSFYPGQGRKGFGGYLPSAKAHLLQDLRNAKVLCFEMEAATLFTLGRVFGIKTGAVLAVVGNRETDEFEPGAGVEEAIEVAVGAVGRLKKFEIKS
jgi:uridine phosphorylase